MEFEERQRKNAEVFRRGEKASDWPISLNYQSGALTPSLLPPSFTLSLDIVGIMPPVRNGIPNRGDDDGMSMLFSYQTLT